MIFEVLPFLPAGFTTLHNQVQSWHNCYQAIAKPSERPRENQAVNNLIFRSCQDRSFNISGPPPRDRTRPYFSRRNLTKWTPFSNSSNSIGQKQCPPTDIPNHLSRQGLSTPFFYDPIGGKVSALNALQPYCLCPSIITPTIRFFCFS